MSRSTPICHPWATAIAMPVRITKPIRLPRPAGFKPNHPRPGPRMRYRPFGASWAPKARQRLPRGLLAACCPRLPQPPTPGRLVSGTRSMIVFGGVPGARLPHRRASRVTGGCYDACHEHPSACPCPLQPVSQPFSDCSGRLAAADLRRVGHGGFHSRQQLVRRAGQTNVEPAGLGLRAGLDERLFSAKECVPPRVSVVLITI